MAPSNENAFPEYSDGDVLIFLSPARQYRLHSTTLRLSSTFFQGVLTDDNAAELDSRGNKENVRVRYRLELELPETETSATEPDGSGELAKGEGVGQLKLRSLDKRGLPIGPLITSVTEAEPAATPEPRLHRHYDNALRSLFHQPLCLSETSGLQSLLHDVLGLVEVAESLGSVTCVSASLDVSLVNYGQTLFRSVAANPRVWAELGVRIRSEVVVREAVCHLVGQAGTDFETRKTTATAAPVSNQDGDSSPTMTTSVAACQQEHQQRLEQLVKRKAEELDMRKQRAEMRLMGFYPDTMMWSEAGQPNVATGSRTTRGTGVPTKVGHHTKHIYDWMAVTLFRHWMGQHTCADRTRRAADGGFHFYGCIARAGEGYIDQDAREKFTKYFPLSAKARTGFDHAMGQVKEGVRKYVAELVQTRCSLDVKLFPVGWLTCTQVSREEMPWNSSGLDETESRKASSSSKDKGKSEKMEKVPERPKNEQPAGTPNSAAERGDSRRKRKQPDSPPANLQQESSSNNKKRLRSARSNNPPSPLESNGDGAGEAASGQQSKSLEGKMHFEIGGTLGGTGSSAAAGKKGGRKGLTNDDEGDEDEADEGAMWDADDEYGE